jgi:hypothetical protein
MALGAIAPGYQADLLVLPDLERFEPETVLKAGKPLEEVPPAEVPEWVRHTVRIQPVASNDFQIPWEGGKARVLGLVEGQIVTDALEEELRVEDGLAVADPRAISPRSPSSSGTWGRGGWGSASCADSACSAARWPRRSPTTRTTSSSWGSTTTTWRARCSGWPSWAAGWS